MQIENIKISSEDLSLQSSSDDPKDAERRKYWDQSLKTYTLLKSNVYLDRKRRVVTEDDIFVCECLKAKPAEAL